VHVGARIAGCRLTVAKEGGRVREGRRLNVYTDMEVEVEVVIEVVIEVVMCGYICVYVASFEHEYR
jgi:hypothetical protein